MAKFKVRFSRKVITYDEVTREIEADDREAAYALAQPMASEFNLDCPDDAAPDGEYLDLESWTVEAIDGDTP